MLSKFIFAGLMGSAAAQAAPGEVVVGTADNLEKLIKDNGGGILIEFYAPWCGHCKKLEPEFIKAAKQLHEDGSTSLLVKVDATVETKLAADYSVNGYPTLKWFVGGSPTDYDGPRDAAGIVTWIKSMTGPAVVDGEPKEDDKVSVTLYGDADAKKWFDEVAAANRKKANWYYVSASTTKVSIKHISEEVIETTPTDKESCEKLYKESMYPLFGGLDGDTFGQYMERENGMIWTLLPMTADNVKEKVEGVRPMMTEIAKELGTAYSVTWTNTIEFGKVLESMFGVKEFPRIVVQKKVGDKKNFIYEGPIEKKDIMAYIDDVLTGKIVATLKSEEAPEEPQADPVKVVVGKNLEAMVYSETKDVLLEIYAPWCGHCKKLEPEYTKVAKKVVKEGFEDILTIAKMDGTQNDSPVDEISWSGFPTIYYVKAGEKTPMKYDGGRDAKGIWKWIKKNHSKADVIKEKLAAKNKDAKKEEL